MAELALCDTVMPGSLQRLRLDEQLHRVTGGTVLLDGYIGG